MNKNAFAKNCKYRIKRYIYILNDTNENFMKDQLMSNFSDLNLRFFTILKLSGKTILFVLT